MARKAKSKFIMSNKAASKKRMVSNKIDESLYETYRIAKAHCEKNGTTLPMSNILTQALHDAIREVNQAYDVDCYQEEIPFNTDGDK